MRAEHFSFFILAVTTFLFSTIIFGGNYGGGTGDPNNPYQIWDANDIIEMSNTSEDWSRHFILMNDVDLSGFHFDKAVVAPDTNNSTYDFEGVVFGGTFRGNNHRITELEISGYNYLGFFGMLILDAQIENLFIDANSIEAYEGSRHIGVLSGDNNGSIRHCSSTGNITGAGKCRYLGGLIGTNSGIIKNSYSTVNITSGHTSYDLGGLVGHNWNGVITSCFAQGDVMSTDGSISENNFSNNIGGLCGTNRGDISNCYTTGTVAGGVNSYSLGGLVGQYYYGDISFCYTVNHGIGGQGILCFWDMEKSAQITGTGGYGRTTIQMMQSETYVGWGNEWTIDEGNGYPRLVWENVHGEVINNIPNASYIGQGTTDEPFLIASPNDISCLSARLQDWDKQFELSNNIDMADIIDYLPPMNFGGLFDGNGYQIRNLKIDESASYLGLFGAVNEYGKVYNLGVADVNIVGDSVLGGLAGSNSGDIRNCYTTGNVSGYSSIGGLCGSNSGNINTSHTSCNITGHLTLGGLVGTNRSGYDYAATISFCYATGDITGVGETPQVLGGLCGNNISYYYDPSEEYEYNYFSSISNCYATGSVVGVSRLGGFVGNNQDGDIVNSYSIGVVTGENSSTVGGFVGYRFHDDRMINNCYWDIDTSGQTNSAGGTGMSTVEMQTQNTFIGWDFAYDKSDGDYDFWYMPDGSYPDLAWNKEHLYSGIGTQDVPYQISNSDELYDMRIHSNDWGRHFILTENIYLPDGEYGIAYISPDTDNHVSEIYFYNTFDGIPFYGLFDGNGYEIVNLSIIVSSEPQNSYLGLFGKTDSQAIIRSLGLSDYSIIGGDDSSWCGGLIGCNEGSVENCFADGNIEGGYNSIRLGGLVGCNWVGAIRACSASGSVMGGYESEMIGGLAGYNWEASISDSYASNRVKGGSHYTSRWTGGFVGWNRDGTISNCYSVGSVSGNSACGFSGDSYVDEYYNNCFWDIETSGTLIGTYRGPEYGSGDVVGLNTEQMCQRATYIEAGWDFIEETTNGTNDLWSICEETNYPRLIWQIPLGDYLCPDGVALEDFSLFAQYWLEADERVNLINDNTIDIDDLRLFCENWLAKNTN